MEVCRVHDTTGTTRFRTLADAPGGVQNRGRRPSRDIESLEILANGPIDRGIIIWTMGIQRSHPTRLVDNFVADSIAWRPTLLGPERGVPFRFSITCSRQDFACRGKALRNPL
jgi:hypothetical protein